MKLWLVPLLLLVATAATPLAQAHQCSGADCGPCVEGETHQHADASGSCNSGPGYYQDAGYGGAKNKTPAPALLALVLAGLGAALLARRA